MCVFVCVYACIHICVYVYAHDFIVKLNKKNKINFYSKQMKLPDILVPTYLRDLEEIIVCLVGGFSGMFLYPQHRRASLW